MAGSNGDQYANPFVRAMSPIEEEQLFVDDNDWAQGLNNAYVRASSNNALSGTFVRPGATMPLASPQESALPASFNSPAQSRHGRKYTAAQANLQAGLGGPFGAHTSTHSLGSAGYLMYTTQGRIVNDTKTFTPHGTDGEPGKVQAIDSSDEEEFVESDPEDEETDGEQSRERSSDQPLSTSEDQEDQGASKKRKATQQYPGIPRVLADLRYTTVEEARSIDARRTPLNIGPGEDDLETIKTNAAQAIILLASTYAQRRPDEATTQNDDLEYEIAAQVKAYNDILAKNEKEPHVLEERLWKLLLMVIDVHENGAYAIQSDVKSFRSDLSLKCSVRVAEIAKVLNQSPLLRKDVITGQRIDQIVVHPKMAAQRKSANLAVNKKRASKAPKTPKDTPKAQKGAPKTPKSASKTGPKSTPKSAPPAKKQKRSSPAPTGDDSDFDELVISKETLQKLRAEQKAKLAAQKAKAEPEAANEASVKKEQDDTSMPVATDSIRRRRTLQLDSSFQSNSDSDIDASGSIDEEYEEHPTSDNKRRRF